MRISSYILYAIISFILIKYFLSIGIMLAIIMLIYHIESYWHVEKKHHTSVNSYVREELKKRLLHMSEKDRKSFLLILDSKQSIYVKRLIYLNHNHQQKIFYKEINTGLINKFNEWVIIQTNHMATPIDITRYEKKQGKAKDNISKAEKIKIKMLFNKGVCILIFMFGIYAYFEKLLHHNLFYLILLGIGSTAQFILGNIYNVRQ